MNISDTTWTPFTSLMMKHIFNVLLVCSDYDRFLIDGDGRVEEQLFFEYTQLGLSSPPKITHTSSPSRAIKLMNKYNFQLVLTMLDPGKEETETMLKGLRKNFPDIPVVALSPSPGLKRSRRMKKEAIAQNINHLFYWQGNPAIFLAMFKLVEDCLNLPHDFKLANLPIIIVCEDSVRYYSALLPLMYTLIIEQNNSIISEALNSWGGALRKRGRPRILLTHCYEDTIKYCRKYKRGLLGVVSDISYKEKGETNPKAGIKLSKTLKTSNPNLPVLLLSTRKENREEAIKTGASFLWKQDPYLKHKLEDYFKVNYGFGPFVFIDPRTYTKLETIQTMREMQHRLPYIPSESFKWHIERNDLSRWFRVRGLYTLAKEIEPLKLSDYSEVMDMQLDFSSRIREYRRMRYKGTISQFSDKSYDELTFFSRIGSGSLGGKGRGLAFIDLQLRYSGIVEKYPDVYLSIPRTVVIASDLYSAFIDGVDTDTLRDGSLSDKEILDIFLEKKLPEELEKSLYTYLNVIQQPISVRSSSLLEDSHYQPFAGVYDTCMIQNTGTKEERFHDLSNAIKQVYASVWFNKSREYLKATGHMIEEEKMAIILQQVIGSLHGQYWYPNISGVAKSINYYPFLDEEPTDGVALLSFGLGKSIVDNGKAYRFAPKYPKRPSPSFQAQKNFYALDMEQRFIPSAEDTGNLCFLDIKESEKHREAIKNIASTFDKNIMMLSENLDADGPKIITYNGILKYEAFPLASIIVDLLELGSKAMDMPIEIEFALNLNRNKPKQPEFSLLQIRPSVDGFESSDVKISDLDKKQAIVYSKSALGNGLIEDVKDIISLKRSNFNLSKSFDMVEELNYFNSSLNKENKSYVLIVAGRLGSSDPWLGIPCGWGQISGADAIVETTLDNISPDPSQGSHFFQNIISQGTMYLTADKTDFDSIERLELVEETNHFVHYRTKNDITIKLDGRTSEGVILLKEHP